MKLILPESYTFQVPDEMLHFVHVMVPGAEKHGPDSWLRPDGPKANHRAMHDSMFHHLAESFVGQRKDPETGLDPLLHLACRSLMLYTRIQRGLEQPPGSLETTSRELEVAGKELETTDRRLKND